MLAVFRADAGLARGGGHVVRCAALAQQLRQRGWRTALAAQSEGLETVAFADSAFDEIQPIEFGATAELVARWPDGCAVAVIDHYQLDARYETALRPWAERILTIVDLVDRRHDCDLLLDVSTSRVAGDYAGLVPNHAKLLIGPAFALLRPDFAGARADRRPHGRSRDRLRIQVMFGATDYGSQSAPTAAALAASGLPIEIEVVLGPTAPSLPTLRAIVRDAPLPVTLAVGATDIAARMAAADLAIGGAGTGSWERCCVGLPALVVVLADNQIEVARDLAAHGAALVLGRAPDVTGETIVEAVRGLIDQGDRLEAMATAAATLCDGRGAERVADAIIGKVN